MLLNSGGTSPEVSPELWDSSLQQTVASMNKMGLTTVYDVGGNSVTPGHYDAVHRANNNDDLRLRVFYTINDQNNNLGTADRIIPALESNTPDNEGLKVAQFGYGESVYRPMRANPFIVSDEDVEHFYNIAVAAAENGWQLNEHSSRDVKVSLMLDVFERVNETHPIGDLRWTIAHNNTTSRESMQRAMNLGMVFAVHSSRRNVSADQTRSFAHAFRYPSP